MSPTALSEHVGAALKRRRELVSVSLHDIIEVAGHGHVSDVKWIESADQPSLRRVLWHYGWVTTAAQSRGTWEQLPYAQRQQWYDTDLDLALHTAAAAKVNTRLWWWGRSQSQGRNGAMCYICEQWIETYDAGRPMSAPVRVKLMAHRSTHRAADTPAPRPYQPKAA